jgi:hypothetical protein
MKIRVAPSLQPFEEKAIETWGLERWQGLEDPDQDVLFFGLYLNGDYDSFRIHKGRKTVFWGGSDILNLMGNYNFRRILKLFPEVEHYCENEVEKKNLEDCGVKVKAVIPSFLENINHFPISYQPSTSPHIFLCGHSDRENEYGWGLVEHLAKRLPEFTFHLYGVERPKEPELLDTLNEIDSQYPNIIKHGKVSREQFNKEISRYHCGLRPNEHDGFSEVTAKSILLGQYPITKIKYPNIWNYETNDELLEKLLDIKKQDKPNYEGRSYYLKNLNQFPFNKNK